MKESLELARRGQNARLKERLEGVDFSSWNERMAEKYNPHDYHTKSIFFIRYIERIRVKAILNFLNPQPLDRILEIGCGAGNLMERFRHGRVCGLDLSKSLLTMATHKTYQTSTYFVRSYGEKSPFANGTFDKIYCSEVLEHLPEPELVCKEAHRLLKQNGAFVVSVPNEASINFFKSLSRKTGVERLIRSFSGYQAPADMTDEWHLHDFDLSLLKQTVQPYFAIEKLKYVPAQLLPIRIVAACRRKS